MSELPRKGQTLPDVEFITESGESLRSKEISGRSVLYFYPKDDTPGCTKEACAFRDRMSDYEAAGIEVYGVSLDSPESHRAFREKHGLNFPLLTDPEGRASEALGVLNPEKGRARRVTFLLGEGGEIAKTYPEVSPETHADEILSDAASL
ncbi:Peroxiredoxin [Rubrobacter radiotolerans]|uniref:thioredoxin-dependent peroxiredoxin n=1 Tax=Rubrobacter radiotolerans TaxID=42256 RepID=A0A023WZP9_RUBRA|nr:peroxiredoxin [Rubrobacter radiotolerans]AHY45431.1 Peroxiredoxin [Rubrobacter radiotolerans]MDX5892842.1 peroxiredoxin [Rubrobacter radiotolerans]SMC02604.1 peroxiredoxin Q/BCP [Rubrobacter radiotolerans DSM 5868]